MDIKRLREVLSYAPDTGKLTWKVRVANRVHVGDEAGYPNSVGYRALELDGKSYLAHRVAWALGHGQVPIKDIDHADGDRCNNALCNLRLVTHNENLQNQRKAMRNNRTGLLGVSLDNRSGHYQARIRLDGKSTALGTFTTAEAAHAAYVKAKRIMHPAGTL